MNSASGGAEGVQGPPAQGHGLGSRGGTESRWAMRKGTLWNALLRLLVAGVFAVGAGIAPGQDEGRGAEKVREAFRAAAQAAVAENWVDAVSALEPLTGSPDAEVRDTALLRQAEALLAAGQPEKALEKAEKAADSPARAILRGRALFGSLRYADAEAALASLPEPTLQDEKIAASAAFLRARIRHAVGQPAESARMLNDYVEKHPNGEFLPSALLTLNETGALTLEGEELLLAGWSGGTVPAMAAAGQFGRAVALARSRPDEAERLFERFLTSFPEHPLTAEVEQRQGDLCFALGKTDVARLRADRLLGRPELPPRLRARAGFLRALVQTSENRWPDAMRRFKEAAALSPDRRAALAAAENAIVATVHSSAGHLPVLGEIFTAYPELESPMRLDAARLAAALGHRQAARLLEEAIARLPASERLAEAELALAELYLLGKPPAVPAARQHWRAASSLAGLSPELRQRLDWFVLWLSELDQPLDAVIAEGQQWLRQWRDSSFRQLVQWKLASWLEKRGLWADAVAQYRQIAAENEDDDALMSHALYQAGLASLRIPSPDSLDQAIDLWGDAALADETLSFPARFQQALAKARLGQTDQAISQIQALLAGKFSPTPAQHRAALAGLGELLLRPSDRDGHVRAAEAAQVFQQLSADASAAPAVRAEAECRQADGWRAEGRLPEALDAYRRTAAHLWPPESAPGARPAAEEDPSLAHWAWRGAFSALEVLEDQAEKNATPWQDVVAWADRLGRIDHPRAGQARQRAETLRLRHFLWDDAKK